jgi:hypothetical protein
VTRRVTPNRGGIGLWGIYGGSEVESIKSLGS